MKTLVIIPDLQIPQHDPKAVAVAQKLIRHIKPDTAVYIGDVIAADAVSRYPETSWEEADQKLDDEIDATNEVLDQFDKVFRQTKTRDILYLEGNHETRVIAWAVKNFGKLGRRRAPDIERDLRLKERGYKYIYRDDQPIRISRFDLEHGEYANQYHAAKNLRLLHRNLFYGHTHDYQVHTGGHSHNDAPKLAMSFGCLCKFKQRYIKGGGTNWIHGLGVIYYDDKGFTPFFIPIVNYRAIWNKKVFEV